ncbi:MAG: hypothetical protein QG651_358 [Pseudomonadota bacterium]|nr:hypothetical protein [Pseudomonadota bacterium]
MLLEQPINLRGLLSLTKKEIKMNQYIIVDEVYDALTSHGDKLSSNLKTEVSYFCDLTDDDANYMFADVIRSRRSHIKWQLVRDVNGAVIMQLTKPEKELKPSVYNLLVTNNLIHSGNVYFYDVVE